MRIITYGCSNTFGAELRDPRTQCWGAQLAGLISLEHIQRARPGASLDGQWLQYLEDLSWLEPTDAIIVGLPPFTRAHGWANNIEQTITAKNLAKPKADQSRQEWLQSTEQVVNWFWFNYLKTLRAWSQDSRASFQPLGIQDDMWNQSEDLVNIEKFPWPWLDSAVTIDCTVVQIGGHPTAKAHTKFAKKLLPAFRARYMEK